MPCSWSSISCSPHTQRNTITEISLISTMLPPSIFVGFNSHERKATIQYTANSHLRNFFRTFFQNFKVYSFDIKIFQASIALILAITLPPTSILRLLKSIYIAEHKV